MSSARRKTAAAERYMTGRSASRPSCLLDEACSGALRTNSILTPDANVSHLFHSPSDTGNGAGRDAEILEFLRVKGEGWRVEGGGWRVPGVARPAGRVAKRQEAAPQPLNRSLDVGRTRTMRLLKNGKDCRVHTCEARFRNRVRLVIAHSEHFLSKLHYFLLAELRCRCAPWYIENRNPCRESFGTALKICE